MTDNKIRCVVVLRLEGKSEDGPDPFGTDDDGMDLTDLSISTSNKTEVTVLAKYDHASQYESSGGADSGTLYGGRDKNYAEAVSSVISKDPPKGVSEAGTIGGFKVVQSENHQVMFGSDAEGICLAVVTGQKYPTRVAISMLSDLYGQFSEQYGLQAASATANSLSKKMKPMLSSVCAKFDDLNKVDKASALMDKVDAVKGTMQDNISSMLKNTEKAETIAQQSDQLNEQAAVFKKKSKDLQKQMRCKNLKMTIILGLLIGGILLVIIVPLILKATNKDD